MHARAKGAATCNARQCGCGPGTVRVCLPLPQLVDELASPHRLLQLACSPILLELDDLALVFHRILLRLELLRHLI